MKANSVSKNTVALSLEKPSKQIPAEHIVRQKLRLENDLLAFMKVTYPKITIFTKLAEDAGLVMNPWANVITPEWKQTDREIFSEPELALIKRAIFRDDELSEFCRPLFLVAAVTGLTEGDICTLKWDEISWATRMIFRKRRKTGVDMAIPILSALENYLKTLPRRGGYVFPVHAEMYLHDASLVSYRIKRFLEGLGIKTTKKPEGRRAISIKDLHSSLLYNLLAYHTGLLVMMAGQLISMIVPQP